jgi:hypothetical protein
MTGIGHFVEAERLLEAAELMDLMDPTRADYIGRANAHASLAAAAASAGPLLSREWAAVLR